MSEEPTCQEVVELVTGYLEGTMPDAQRRAFDQHLEECEGCRNYLEQMRATILLSGRIEPESLSPEACEELVAAFRGWALA